MAALEEIQLAQLLQSVKDTVFSKTTIRLVALLIVLIFSIINFSSGSKTEGVFLMISTALLLLMDVIVPLFSR